MIKKTLLWLWIIFLSFIGFSSAEDLLHDFPYNFYTQDVNNIIDRNLNFENVWQDQISHNRLFLKFYSSERKFIFWRNWKIYFYQRINWADKQWYFTKVCKIYSETWSLTFPIDCYPNTPSRYSNISEFYDLQNPIFTKVAIVPEAWYNILWIYDSTSKYFYFFSQEYLDWSINLPYDIIDISSFVSDSPYDNSIVDSSVVGIQPWTVESALNYYEKHYWWNSSICYAWVDSLTYLYWQNWVSYTLWTWLSIFEVYEWLYWNESNKKDFLLYSSRWLNSWLINYNEWFNTNWNPSWIASYNSWSHLVDYIFTWFTFPFANQPVAIYFLTDNIQSQTEQLTQWEEVISYCNLKINNWTFDEIIGSWNKNNINSYTEQWNTNIWLNPDWTKHEYTGAFLWSWVELAFSWNLSIKNTLNNFFDKLGDSMNINSDPWIVGLLPDWLIVAFLTIMLFKFFRKKS